jgi:hypothetical protein
MFCNSPGGVPNGRYEVRGEVPQEWRLPGNPMRRYVLAILPYCIQNFDYVFKMALRVHPAGEG